MSNTPGERFDRSSTGTAYKPETRMHDPRDIQIDPNWNGRIMSSPETQAWIATIEASILKDGVREAIKVSYDKATGIRTLVAGECRLTACRNLWARGHKILIPCQRVEGDEIELTIENVSSNTGLPLTQWEAGAEYRKLLRWGQNIDDIAARVCKPKRYVTEAIALSNTPIEAKEMLAAGTVTPGAVLHAVAGKDGDSLPALKKRVEAAPKPQEPAKATLPGTPAPQPKPVPVARPKKASVKEQIIKSMEAKPGKSVLELADAMYRLIMDEQPWNELELAAKAYGKARGL
jgi:hypothetical protein